MTKTGGAAAPFSVIIPACNEEAVIDRCLASILSTAPEGEAPEIIVVCNGCTDATAARARRWPRVRVIELETGSKPAALNAGNRAARAVPRFFLDADVTVTCQALAAAAAVLREPGVMAAAPRRRLDFEDCSWAVRRYYAVWQTLPFAMEGIGGCGVYGLSEAAIAEIGEFPNVVSDDGFVRLRFPPSARRSVATDAGGEPAHVTVFPPRTLVDLVRVEARRRRGNTQLRALYPGAHERSDTPGRLLSSLLRGLGPVDVAVYVGVKLAGRALHRMERMRGTAGGWLRDESSRLGAVR